MQTANSTILASIAQQALKKLDEQAAISDSLIADMYMEGFRTFDDIAGALNVPRTTVVMALFRMNLLPGQPH